MEKKLDKYLEESLFYHDLPGLVFSVKKGDFTYQKAAGYSNYITKKKLRVEEIFHMCSVSKLFTSSAILLLQEEGKLSIEEYLYKVLPWLKIEDERFKKIKIKDMLTHTSGLGDVKDYGWDKPQTDNEALKRYALSTEVTKEKLLWSPSENKFQYSNVAYELLGCIIAEVSGTTFEGYIEKNIFNPLGMNDSTFLTSERNGVNMAQPHKKDKEKNIILEEHYPYNRAHGPSSTLTTNAADIAKWGEAHLKKSLLKEETYELAWEQYAVVSNNGEGMGLSWFMREQNGYKLLGHEGTDDGFRSSFWICPELDIHISVMTNISMGRVKKINKGIFDLITE